MQTSITETFSQHSVLLGTVAVGSMVLLLISILAIPWLVAQLPIDYLLQRDKRTQHHRVLGPLFTLLRTVIGLALILLGLVMLVIPGPGLITLLVGLSLASFPGKRSLLRHLASRDSVFNSLNWMRTRYGKPPLLHPLCNDP